MVGTYRKHPQEFKKRAVNMVLEQKKPKAQVARDLGISPSTLDLWILRFEESNAFDGGKKQKKSNSSSDSERIQDLEKQLKRVTMERDILKKATAYFAKESL